MPARTTPVRSTPVSSSAGAPTQTASLAVATPPRATLRCVSARPQTGCRSLPTQVLTTRAPSTRAEARHREPSGAGVSTPTARSVTTRPRLVRHQCASAPPLTGRTSPSAQHTAALFARRATSPTAGAQTPLASSASGQPSPSRRQRLSTPPRARSILTPAQAEPARPTTRASSAGASEPPPLQRSTSLLVQPFRRASWLRLAAPMSAVSPKGAKLFGAAEPTPPASSAPAATPLSLRPIQFRYSETHRRSQWQPSQPLSTPTSPSASRAPSPPTRTSTSRSPTRSIQRRRAVP